MNVVTVHNDGELAVQCISDDSTTISFGIIQRVHSIDARAVEQSSREEFLQDLPVSQKFLDYARHNGFIDHVERSIMDALASRRPLFTLITPVETYYTAKL